MQVQKNAIGLGIESDCLKQVVAKHIYPFDCVMNTALNVALLLRLSLSITLMTVEDNLPNCMICKIL